MIKTCVAKIKTLQIDGFLLISCTIVSVWGIVLIFSATRHTDSFRYVVVQSVAVIAGGIAFVMSSSLDVEKISCKYRIPLMVGSVLIVLLLLTPLGVGAETTGNRSWLDIPFIPVNIQPAEVVKIPYILVLSYYFSKEGCGKQAKIARLKALLFAASMVLIIVVVSGDYGMALVYGGIYVVLAWIGGVEIKWFILGGVGILIAGVLLWEYVPEYIQMRILVVFDHTLDPGGKGWQQTRSLIAIGGGGLTGQGFLQGVQTQSEFGLPARHTDEIFAVCGEEFGLWGCFFCMLGLAIIIGRCFMLAHRAPTMMLSLISAGFAGALSLQTIINIGVTLYVFPVVGLTLPFISYGGSSVLSLYFSMGLISNVSTYTPKRK